jgi:IS6 family transposase
MKPIVRVTGGWTCLYRAIDSAGNSIDFLLSPKRDRTAARGFLQLALSAAAVGPRFVKKRITATQGFRSVEGALSTIAGYEAMNIIRKGQIRWLAKGEVPGQKRFIERLFGTAALTNSRLARQCLVICHCDTTENTEMKPLTT